MTPVVAVPVEIGADAMFEAAPDCGARIGCRGVNDNGSAVRSPAIIDPVIAPLRALLARAFNEVSLGTRTPDVYGAVEFLDIALGHEDGQRAPAARVGVQVIGELPDPRVLRWPRLVRHIQKGDGVGKILFKKPHPGV